MKVLSLGIAAMISFLAISCKQEAAKQSGNGGGTDEKKEDGTSADSEEEEEERDGYFTGFDGVTDYSILVPKFRNLVVEDESIAKVESVKITLSAAIIDELVAKAKVDNEEFNETGFRKMIGREQTTYKITPLKAGKTVISTSGGRGGQPNKQQNGWAKSAKIDLVVTSYTEEQLASGKSRYTTDGGGGNLRACKSCHETGEEGAPPHELGKIMEISDKQAMTWIKTGKLDGRVASIQHTWEFSTEEEEGGIVSYLRSKQTHDVETLTKLIVEEQLANGGFMPPPSDAKKEETEKTE